MDPAVIAFASDELLYWYGPRPVDSELAEIYAGGKLSIRAKREDEFPRQVASMMGLSRSQLMTENDGAFGPAIILIRVEDKVATLEEVRLPFDEDDEGG